MNVRLTFGNHMSSLEEPFHHPKGEEQAQTLVLEQIMPSLLQTPKLGVAALTLARPQAWGH